MLPAGTLITLPDEASAAQVRAVAVNEIEPVFSVQCSVFSFGTSTSNALRGIGTENRKLKTENSITLTAPLQLVSPAHIAERDQAEKNYAARIVALEEQLRATTAK